MPCPPIEKPILNMVLMTPADAQTQEKDTDAQSPAADRSVTDNAGATADTVLPPGLVQFGTHDIYIDSNAPLAQYSKPHAPAFRAIDTETNRKYIAVLTGKQVIPRFASMSVFKNLHSPHLQQYHAGRPVVWPADNISYFVCLFDPPRGLPVMDEQGTINLDIGPDCPSKYITSHIIGPFVKLLEELRENDIAHGAMNLQNLYGLVEGETVSLMFGECVSAPYSYTQPALFEPVSRALADPVARGKGAEKHDLYSLGVCIALLVMGKNPLANVSDKDIIARKIEIGSYAAIVGNERISSNVAEFLRAVLTDEYSSRWGMEETLKWLDGSRMTKKPSRPTEKAARAFTFNKKKYSYIRNLAQAFIDQPTLTIQTLKEKKFLQWMHRNIADKNTIANFDKNFGSDKNPAEDYSDQNIMVTHAAIALDPDSPIRYKNMAILPAGYGSALAHAVLHNENVSTYLEILQRQLYHYWFDMQHIHIDSSSSLNMDLERARNTLRQKMPGRGFERILYALNTETHCLSPLLKDAYARDAADLLLAFETLAANNAMPKLENVFDRHVIAFLLQHESKVIEPVLSMIVSVKNDHRIIGLMRCFSAIQKNFNNLPTPHLLSWFIQNITPALERIHDKRLRQHITEGIGKLADETQLSLLVNLVDNPDTINEDLRHFVIAKAEYQAFEFEQTLLKTKLSGKNSLGFTMGRQAAMMVSVIVSTIMILISLAHHFQLI